jgi:AcrR family transcriptional regulator
MSTPTGQATSAPVRRGRPRSEKAHQAILKAAADLLLARGLGAVSMDAVAEAAGVSKATICRWWPTKETLALDALFEQWNSVRATATDQDGRSDAPKMASGFNSHRRPLGYRQVPNLR